MRCLFVHRCAGGHLGFRTHRANPRRKERDFDLIGWEVRIDDRTPDDLGVVGDYPFDDGGSFGDFSHANVFAAGDIEQHAFGTTDFDIEERRLHRRFDCLLDTVFTGTHTDCHQCFTGIFEDRLHVREIDVDDTGFGNQV